MAAHSSTSSLLKGLRTYGPLFQRRSGHGKTYYVPQGQQAHPIGDFYQCQVDYKPPFATGPPQATIPPATKKTERLAKTDPVKKSTNPPPPPPAARPVATKPEKKAKSELVQSSTPSPPPSPTSSSPSLQASPPSVFSTAKSSSASGPSIIFGSRLNAADPKARKERLDALRRAGTRVMGVLVPAKPDEPDNCCMSGCVNCVWDTFREEMEMWADANSKVEERRSAAAVATARFKAVQVQKSGDGNTSSITSSVGSDEKEPSSLQEAIEQANSSGQETPVSSSSRPSSKNLWDDELYKNIPVGIREFMKLEKKLNDPSEDDASP